MSSKTNSRASSAGSKKTPENQYRMTKCFAMLTLKITNPDFNANDVQSAYHARIETIKKQEQVCEILVRTFSGSPKELKVGKKAIQLQKDKAMVRTIQLQFHCNMGYLHSNFTGSWSGKVPSQFDQNQSTDIRYGLETWYPSQNWGK